MATQRQVKRMLILNPGSPREKAAKRRASAAKEGRRMGVVKQEQKRRKKVKTLFGPFAR